MVDIQMIEAAHARLLADSGLPYQIAAQVRQAAARARQTHPRGYAALDADLARDLGAASALSGAEQLLELERLTTVWLATEAEAVAHADERATRERHVANEARFAPVRERAREDWAAATAASVLSALPTFAGAAAEADRQIRARRPGDESSFAEALDLLDRATRTLVAAVSAARRESRMRNAAAEAEAVVAKVCELAS